MPLQFPVGVVQESRGDVRRGVDRQPGGSAEVKK